MYFRTSDLNIAYSDTKEGVTQYANGFEPVASFADSDFVIRGCSDRAVFMESNSHIADISLFGNNLHSFVNGLLKKNAAAALV